MPVILFQPSGKRIEVADGTRLIDACRRVGFALPVPCGEKGLCGKCRVRVVKGDIPTDSRQVACLPVSFLADGWRASCVARVHGDLVLADPEDGRTAGVILTDFADRRAASPHGLWRRDITMPPSGSDRRDDAMRLLAALAEAGISGLDASSLDIALFLSRIPGILRDAAFRCRVVGMGRHILSLRDCEGACRNLGLAVDLGTTTIAAALCDLDNGDVLAVASAANPQAEKGDDVISRLEYASRGAGERRELQTLAVEALETLADETRRKAGTDAPILLLAVAGNTVMNHLLLGVEAGALAVSPFIPAFRSAPTVPASHIGWKGGEAPLLLTIPNIAAYIGGDITAGMAALAIPDLDGVTLFLDVGTNGEIVLAANDRMFACAAAAGPAFEGARIRQGMRAAPGAVSRVEVAAAGGLDVVVMDAAGPAKGVCGTGLLDAVAALLRTGLVDATGRMLEPGEARDAGMGEPLLSLLHEDGDGIAVWLEKPSLPGERGVALTARDVREFQLAKGAVAAGVRVLLDHAGIRPEDVDQVLLAGGFGSYLSPVSALATGLLPRGIPAGRVRAVGNAALAGARFYLLSDEERGRTEEAIGRVEYIELSGRDDFQHLFAEEMLFPEW